MADTKETTGGTKSRMDPGKEGRGGVRRQRAPELHADLRGECKKLATQAIQIADHLGHTSCIVWQVNPDGNAGQIKCSLCEKLAGFAECPRQKKVKDPSRPGKVMYLPGDQISGPIVTERCAG